MPASPPGHSPTVALPREELRQRAVAFAAKWADATSEKSEATPFWIDLLGVFDRDPKQVAVFEAIAEKSTGGAGYIDLLLPGQMAVEHKTRGADLDAAMGQLVGYLPNLPAGEMPWLLVACDFHTFRWRDLERGVDGEFTLDEFDEHLDLLGWLAGYQRPGVVYETEEEVNLKATALLRDVHDELAASGYPAHALREWMTRVLFCLFADDTGVWDRGAFHNSIVLHTSPDGHDLGGHLALLFQILNQPADARQANLGEQFAPFVYINGDLFAEQLPLAACNRAIRDALLEACTFDWAAISPAIFGSMFQNVMAPPERRQLGAHYTTEANILKTIGPLFLDELWADLDKATTKPALRKFLDRLASLSFFDPACGCGNFLVIAYREIRALETETLRRLHAKEGKSGQLAVDLTLQCQVRVDQFYGIELEEFPAKIARTALYLMDHLANREVSAEFGQHFVRFPIPAAPHIEIGNALQDDWNALLPAEQADFVFGNPPFVGRKHRTAEQKADLATAWDHQRGHAVLDFVTGWFIRAARYTKGPSARVAFVATNSVSQGETVSALWPSLYAAGVTIDFAHRPFEWQSEAQGRAHVHVVIVGFSHVETNTPRLFLYPTVTSPPIEARATNISPYLADGPNTVVVKSTERISADAPRSLYGSTTIDNGHLLVGPDDIDEFRADSIARKYLRPYIGATELISGTERWVLWLKDAPRSDIRSSLLLKQRVEACRAFRANSSRAATQRLAATPHLLGEPRPANAPSLVVPCVSSSSRRWLPTAFRGAETLTRASSWCIPHADIFTFGIISSSMFTSWARGIGGGMKSDLQVSQGTVYNTFPWAQGTPARQRQVKSAAQEVLDARSAHPDATLADLYDPLAMPAELVRAHERLDRAVDPLFAGRKRMREEADRLGVLLERYASITDRGQLEIGTPEPR